MKKLSSKMKVVLILAICAAFIVPSVAFAGSPNILVPNDEYPEGSPMNTGVFGPGRYTLEELPLTVGETLDISLRVVNGNGVGDDVVSSVKLTLLDEKGKPKEVVISPSDFSQNMDKKKNVEFSTVNGQIPLDSVEGMETFSLDLKVGGPKNSYIILSVIELVPSPTPGGRHSF